MNVIRKIIFIIVLVSLMSNPSLAAQNAEEYDPQHTMLALNMAIVSVHRILATQDRLILDQEYQNIMNNLSLGNIRSDSDITKLYEKLMDIASQKRLREKEAEHVRKRYDSLMEGRLTKAISDAAGNSMRALEGGKQKCYCEYRKMAVQTDTVMYSKLLQVSGTGQ